MRWIALLGIAAAPVAIPSIASAAPGDVLVIAPHPDDEALGFAGVMEQAQLEGRRATVAVVTNGEKPPFTAGFGLRRNRESHRAMAHLLGAGWAPTPNATLVNLGYPGNNRLLEMWDTKPTCTPGSGYQSPTSGRRNTWAASDVANESSTAENGDYRFLRTGQHACYSRQSLVDDIADLIGRTGATEIHTTAEFDRHPDHQATFRAVRAALAQTQQPSRFRATIIHSPHVPPGGSDIAEANEWPNPAYGGSTPTTTCNSCTARFTPNGIFAPHPGALATFAAAGLTWSAGYAAAPAATDPESVPVPASMRTGDLSNTPGWDQSSGNTNPATCARWSSTNLKWQTLQRYCSQLWPRVSEQGYMLSFVKANEFFWVFSPRPAAVADAGAGQTGTTGLNASWAQVGGAGANATGYRVALGTAPGAADVRGFQDVGGATSTSFTGLSLAAGGTYFVTVGPYRDFPTGERIFGPQTASDGIVAGSTGAAGGPGSGGGANGLRKVKLTAKAVLFVKGGKRFVRVVGATDKRLKGRRVTVQRKIGRRVAIVGRPKIGKLGRYQATGAVPRSGKVLVRARVARTATTREALTRFAPAKGPLTVPVKEPVTTTVGGITLTAHSGGCTCPQCC